VTQPSDPVEVLKWAAHHWGDAWWLIGAIAAGMAWTSKRLGDWRRRNAVAVTARPRAAALLYQAPFRQAPGPAAQPAPARPAPPAATHPASASHRPRREPAPAQRATAPIARSVNVPPPASGAWTLSSAFGDPAHARTAVIVAEVLGPPVALR